MALTENDQLTLSNIRSSVFTRHLHIHQFSSSLPSFSFNPDHPMANSVVPSAANGYRCCDNIHLSVRFPIDGINFNEVVYEAYHEFTHEALNMSVCRGAGPNPTLWLEEIVCMRMSHVGLLEHNINAHKYLEGILDKRRNETQQMAIDLGTFYANNQHSLDTMGFGLDYKQPRSMHKELELVADRLFSTGVVNDVQLSCWTLLRDTTLQRGPRGAECPSEFSYILSQWAHAVHAALYSPWCRDVPAALSRAFNVPMCQPHASPRDEL